MCGFVRAIMSLAIVRSNTLSLQGARNKEAYISRDLILRMGKYLH